ncbi:hypothetical protein [Marinobacterium lutimaris]|uniref:DUF4352 domain-containing protein n=1 Tax=Marinobacterium lutimaris TaxID=568106 RepID=A0A1H5YCF0_9GAMM|nr:hypothetical protein [Marinobacterium lutimaris]SEG21307.1 hypothetical protein SAMN05444390_1011691 [Marinobacterium lutimaris]
MGFLVFIAVLLGIVFLIRRSSAPGPGEVREQSGFVTGMGIGAIVLGVIAIATGWVPFLGVVALPIAGFGIVVALIGLLAGIRTSSVGMPVAGVILCALPLAWQGMFFGAITSNAYDDYTKRAAASAQASTETPAKQELPNKQSYINNSLELYGISSSYYNASSGLRVPGVDFKIRNNGDHSLDRVEVTFYFLDSAGQVVFEKSYNPVLVTTYGNEPPLKPGYIWQQQTGKFYRADGVPSEWEEGLVRTAITDIEYSE